MPHVDYYFFYGVTQLSPRNRIGLGFAVRIAMTAKAGYTVGRGYSFHGVSITESKR